MPKYKHTNLSKLRTSIARGLGDEEMVFWTTDEINTLVEEALLTFGAISGFWKNDVSIKTAENKVIYNLFTDAEDTTDIAPSLTYEDVIGFLNRDLIESLTDLAPTSEYFSLEDLLKLIELKYNQFQLATGLILSSSELNVAPQQNLMQLPDAVLDIVRLAYIESNVANVLDNVVSETILGREDEETIAQFDTFALTEEGATEYYSTVYGSPNTIKLYPIPANHGVLRLISVNNRDSSVPLTQAIVLYLANNLAPYIKFGVLATIFNQDGILNDPARAAYCEQRWKEGILIGRNYTSILLAKSDGIVIETDSLEALRLYHDLKVSSDRPQLLGLAGFNIFSLDRIPDDQEHSLDFVTISNAPIPVDDEDFIDVEEDYIKVIVDYVVHLAQFKCGAVQLQATNSYKEEFLKTAINHNIRLQQRGISYENLIGKTKLQERDVPRLVEENAR